MNTMLSHAAKLRSNELTVKALSSARLPTELIENPKVKSED